ncbi:ribosome biosynthesis protein LTO1 [Sporobolomyces salmoneus]|uniref:ribosome biosynthesis protein LTO1 n=1 Tax=Sporobolomyces salmoneus TaxID=183962 RepID=UPI00317860A7
MNSPFTHSGEFDSLLDLESQFYTSGFNSGLPHGELHGLFEGRELGREKSWELWEEIGYYQGVARLWKVILERQGKGSTRSMQALDQILSLVAAFPSSNDSSSLLSESSTKEARVDIAAQLSTLRSKYKTVCATLGIRSRMAVSSGSTTTTNGGDLKQMGMSL